MPWDYLQDERWDERFKVAATWLEGIVKDPMPILDLNCGTARLTRYLHPRLYSVYIGNDKHVPYIEEAHANCPQPMKTLFTYSDDLAMRALKIARPHVLACFGIGAGEFVKNGHESETQLETMRALIHRNKPSAVIVECCAPYWLKYLREPIVSMLTGFGLGPGPWRAHDFKIEVPKPDIYHSRHMELWLRKDCR